jgi:hypothetical protein
LKEAWNTAQQTSDKREKLQALSLAKDCYSMKLELLTNATVVEDAIKFVSHNRNENGAKIDDNNTLDDIGNEISLSSESKDDKAIRTHNNVI